MKTESEFADKDSGQLSAIFELKNRSRVASEFQKRFAGAATIFVRAPGRVNLIGEHTDYNQGFVLPAAIDRSIFIAARPRSDKEVRLYSINYNEDDRVSLAGIGKSNRQWCNYYRAVLSTMSNDGYELTGFDAVVDGDLPQGAGLSSSAAYELAVAALINSISSFDLDRKSLALLCQRAENTFIGVNCGIMDQFASALAKAEAALLIDCRTLATKAVPLPLAKHGAALVITNTGVTRGLVESEYNTRREQCEESTKRLGKLLGRKLDSLRDVTVPELEQCQSRMPEEVSRRCRHVVKENERVLEAVNALQKTDLARLGALMNESHASLRDDYEVSCSELDYLVDLTQKHPGTYGTRMTGAGFGGCTVTIMEEAALDDYRSSIVPKYERETGRKAEIYLCKAVAGVCVQKDGVEVPLRDE
jgi:galactokinase